MWRLGPLLGNPRLLPRWGGALLLCTLLAAAASFWHVRSGEQAQRALSSAEALRLKLRIDATRPAPAKTPQADFTSLLPAYAPIEPVVRDLQRFSGRANVNFVSLDALARNATVQTLGRTEIAVTLRGEYPALKAVLAQVLERYPHLVLQRLTLRRLSVPSEVEASVNLVLLSRPPPATGSGG